jgi:hypothetical protein
LLKGIESLNAIPGEAAAEPPYESYGREALESQIRGLQPLDPFVAEQRWTLYPEGVVDDTKPFNGKWTVDDRGLVRKDGRVFIPRDPAVKVEILRVNHDNPWDGGHFGVTYTIKVV